LTKLEKEGEKKLHKLEELAKKEQQKKKGAKKEFKALFE